MKSAPVLTLALLLAACGSKDDAAAPPAEPAAVDQIAPSDMTEPVITPATPVDAAGYIAKAGAGDMWEIESSKALLAKSTNANVKAFAQMMIDNHGKSTAKVKAAAVEAKIDVAAPKLDVDQQKRLDEIKAADAAAIDAVYLAHQAAAHDAALALHRNYAASGDSASLKRAASEIVPVVEAHRAELGKLAAKR
jgi:putative membrane protein